MNIAVYPGSFDPITNGHLDIIRRAAKLYDKVVVGVLTNASKQPMFEKSQRADFIRRSTAALGNVEVAFFEGLLVDFLKKENAKVILKGLRATSDFEYEFQMALVNKQLCPDVETVFLSSSAKYTFLSSSVVREIGRLGGDISMFIPAEILDDVKTAMTAKK
ncbi:MAG: pantetheine-phosphate adenylyltransferase [Clostridia bacterium]|nr:pantetheine-phosphate adenylyltransferase [Clostridia bacterium]